MPGYGISEASEGILPWSWAEKRLAASRNYFVATVRPDGRPHVMPVWGVWFDGRFYFHTGGRSQKARNLRVNADCVVTTEGAREPVVLEGRARIVSAKKAFQNFARIYKEKYDWDPDPSIGDAWVVQPSRVLALIETESQFSTSATR